jgi:hypothetical protein
VDPGIRDPQGAMLTASQFTPTELSLRRPRRRGAERATDPDAAERTVAVRGVCALKRQSSRHDRAHGFRKPTVRSVMSELR